MLLQRHWNNRNIAMVAVKYGQTSSIRVTKSQYLNVSGLVLKLSLPNPLEARC